MKVLSIGFGFVGKAYAIYLKENGNEVFVLTNGDKTKDDSKRYGFSEPQKGDSFDAAIIAVPTPTKNNKFDPSILEDAVAKAIKFSSKNIIIKSTIAPGTTRNLKEKYAKTEFYFYPEFLEAKNPIGGVFNQKIIVFGNDKWSNEKIAFIKELFKMKDIETTDYETAETVKYVHNLWLASNISFWNSMLRTSSKKVDFELILRQVHKSEYFGTHPWKVGGAYGGECIPKDVLAYAGQIKDENEYKQFILGIDRVNKKVALEEKK